LHGTVWSASAAGDGGAEWDGGNRGHIGAAAVGKGESGTVVDGDWAGWAD